MKQNKGRKKQKLQKGTKNAIKEEKRKTLSKKRRETNESKKEETRKGMRGLVATDDPRPMSVSLRPQNKQLSMKDETKGGKPGGATYFLREKHGVFPTKIAQKGIFF